MTRGAITDAATIFPVILALVCLATKPGYLVQKNPHSPSHPFPVPRFQPLHYFKSMYATAVTDFFIVIFGDFKVAIKHAVVDPIINIKVDFVNYAVVAPAWALSKQAQPLLFYKVRRKGCFIFIGDGFLG